MHTHNILFLISIGQLISTFNNGEAFDTSSLHKSNPYHGCAKLNYKYFHTLRIITFDGGEKTL